MKVKVRKIERLRKREGQNSQKYVSLEEENKMLKVNMLKKQFGNDSQLKDDLENLESQMLHDLGKKTLNINKLRKELKDSERETRKANERIGQVNAKLKMREEEIEIHEEKITSLQITIK